MGGLDPVVVDELKTGEEPTQGRGGQCSAGTEPDREARRVVELKLPGSHEEQFCECGRHQ